MKTTPQFTILDTHFRDETSVIASYLFESDEGLIIIETGPETTFEPLKRSFKEKGYDWKDVRHVLLTHIHFDHAGAAWKFAENGARIYVHPIGLPHLENPEKLWNSAKRIYKDDMESLWGEMKPIDKNLLVPLDDGDEINIGGIDFKTRYTPGHAIHHNAYKVGDIIFTGDVGGVQINDGPVVPPCPPPDINIETWKESIQKLRNENPAALYPTHYGRVDHPKQHLADLENILDDWADWIKPFYDKKASVEEITPKFVDYTARQLRESGVDDDDVDRYEKANPSYMSVTGLMRYWKLKAQGRI